VLLFSWLKLGICSNWVKIITASLNSNGLGIRFHSREEKKVQIANLITRSKKKNYLQEEKIIANKQNRKELGNLNEH
jgi:hypothetical protein